MPLPDLLLVAALFIIIAGLASLIGGALGYSAAAYAIRHVLRVVEIQVQAVAVSHRIVAPAEVQLRVHVPAPDPVTVPVVTAPMPSARDLAERVLAVYPETGPTDLAVIVGCAKSTAHAILHDRKPAVGTALPAAPQQLNACVGDLEEISAWPPGPTHIPFAAERSVPNASHEA
jgi:hypothetical protein